MKDDLLLLSKFLLHYHPRPIVTRYNKIYVSGELQKI